VGVIGWLQNWGSDWVNGNPGTGISVDHNYCRNPDYDSSPWCYTGSGSAWAYCDIAECEPAVCNPAQQEEDFTHSQCFKWGTEHELDIQSVHVGGSVDTPFLPTDLDKVGCGCRLSSKDPLNSAFLSQCSMFITNHRVCAWGDVRDGRVGTCRTCGWS
jgi:hypothetical protein